MIPVSSRIFRANRRQHAAIFVVVVVRLPLEHANGWEAIVTDIGVDHAVYYCRST